MIFNPLEIKIMKFYPRIYTQKKVQVANKTFKRSKIKKTLCLSKIMLD